MKTQQRSPFQEALVGFGSNIGNSIKTCKEAIGVLANHPGIELRQVSSFYRTEPIGFASENWFINGVLHVDTILRPQDLLVEMLRIESLFGRKRKERWESRTLDLDLLFYGNLIIHTPLLQLPHPRICERRFVLEPLAEVVPSKVHPVLHKTIAGLLIESSGSLERQKLEKIGSSSGVKI